MMNIMKAHILDAGPFVVRRPPVGRRRRPPCDAPDGGAQEVFAFRPLSLLFCGLKRIVRSPKSLHPVS